MLIKTGKDIKNLKKGGKILGEILSRLVKVSKPGVSTIDIDRAAEEMILKAGGRPAFKFYKNHPTDPPFPATICASLNDEIVHGIPRKDLVLKNGDIFSIDIGMEYPVEGDKGGFFTDTAITFAIGDIPAKTRKLLEVTNNALWTAIDFIKPGISLAELGGVIEEYVRSQGKYGIIRDLSGHGVGHAVHEEPWVPNYYEKRLEKIILKPGMVLALEPMITLGDWRITTAADGWTIKTADGSLCAHFEHTIVVTKKGCDVITLRPEER